jgi:hypothetical protein
MMGPARTDPKIWVRKNSKIEALRLGGFAMMKKRFFVEQIVAVLKAELGVPIPTGFRFGRTDLTTLAT